MFGTSAGWWNSNAIAGNTMACGQQWQFAAGVQPATQSAGGIAMSAAPAVDSGFMLAGPDSLPRSFRQPCGSLVDVASGPADGMQRWASSPIWWTAAGSSALLPSPAAEFGVGSSDISAFCAPACSPAVSPQFASVPAQLPSLPVDGQLPLKESPLGRPSCYGHQSSMKRRYAPSNVDLDDDVPYKTRLTDEKMVSRLQGLSLQQQSSGSRTAEWVMLPTTEERFCSTSRSAPTHRDELGWQKFQEVEQRLAAIEEEAPDIVAEHAGDCSRIAESGQIGGLRLELSPELQAHLTTSELTAALQNAQPQQSLALVLWKAPDNGPSQATDGVSDGSARLTGNKEDRVAVSKEDDDPEELPAEPRKDVKAAQSFAALSRSVLVDESALTPTSMESLAGNDDRMMDT